MWQEAWWSRQRKWWDHKPSSVYSLVRADGHLSGMAVASHLVRPTRSSNDPGRVSLLIWPCSDRGLPCHACYQARGGLLPHRFTLTLWIQGRSVLCGPVPSPYGAQALPGGLPCGARTFLEWPLLPATRDHRPHHFHRKEITGRLGAWARLISRTAELHAPRCLKTCRPARSRRAHQTPMGAAAPNQPPRGVPVRGPS